MDDRPFTILDVNNFWSPTGGGVRRYELEKAAYFAAEPNVKFVFALPARETRTEQRSANVAFEHIGGTLPSPGGYRNIVLPRRLRQAIARHQPDVVECGSPIFLPLMMKWVTATLARPPVIVGFWHADFPRTYTGLGMRTLHPSLEPYGERFGWWWMRKVLGNFDALFVASRWVGQNMLRNGFDRLYYTPLGVDSETFSPARHDPALAASLRAGNAERPILLFPHRFSEEKGISSVLAAYEELERRLDPVPALVFAGTGPARRRVEEFAATKPHVHYLGYIDSRDELAALFASSDICLCLSKFETFGLSTAEALASGLAVIAADQGAAKELVDDSGAGLTVPYDDSRALVDAIVKLITEGRHRQRGEAGRAHVERLTWQAAFSRELHYYRDLVAAKRLGRKVESGFHGVEELGPSQPTDQPLRLQPSVQAR